jgi:AP-3 complex subunit beta
MTRSGNRSIHPSRESVAHQSWTPPQTEPSTPTPTGATLKGGVASARGFGSESFARGSSGGKASSPVVLTPTVTRSGNASPVGGRPGGFRDLDDFLASEDEEEEDEDEEESEEGEEEDEEEETGSEESGEEDESEEGEDAYHGGIRARVE